MAVLGRARAGRRGRPHHARADGGGQPRHGPDRGDAEDPRRRGRGAPRRHALATAVPARTGPTTASATPRSPRCAGPSRRRWRAFGTDGRCLMRALRRSSTIPAPSDCGRCSVCTAPRFAGRPTAALVERAGRHLRSRPVELEVKKMAPDAAGDDAQDPRRGARRARLGAGPLRRRRLVAGDRTGPAGRGLRIRGGHGVGRRRELGHRRPRRGSHRSRRQRLGDRVERLAERVAAALGITFCGSAPAPRPRPPQREMANAAQQAANVRGAFRSSPRRRRAPASCSMTAGTPAGRWRWSGGSCAARAPSGSSRSRSAR